MSHITRSRDSVIHRHNFTNKQASSGTNSLIKSHNKVFSSSSSCTFGRPHPFERRRGGLRRESNHKSGGSLASNDDDSCCSSCSSTQGKAATGSGGLVKRQRFNKMLEDFEDDGS